MPRITYKQLTQFAAKYGIRVQEGSRPRTHEVFLESDHSMVEECYNVEETRSAIYGLISQFSLTEAA